jgi:hypothetical protein
LEFGAVRAQTILERVIREWNKIEPYKAQWFIADWP